MPVAVRVWIPVGGAHPSGGAEGKSLAELTRKHRDERPVEPSAIVPDLAPALERTILACLEKDPRRRPPV